MKRTYVKWWRLFRDSPQWEGLGIARTLVLSATVGAGAGLGAVLLVAMLQITQWFFFGFIANYEPSVPVGEPVFLKNLPEITGEIRRWTFLFLPAVGGLISGIIVHRFAPEAAGHGTDAAIEAYHFRGGRVRPAVPPIKAIATSLLIGSGGSAGCEGPITQIGSGFGSGLGSTGVTEPGFQSARMLSTAPANCSQSSWLFVVPWPNLPDRPVNRSSTPSPAVLAFQ